MSVRSLGISRYIVVLSVRFLGVSRYVGMLLIRSPSILEFHQVLLICLLGIPSHAGVLPDCLVKILSRAEILSDCRDGFPAGLVGRVPSEVAMGRAVATSEERPDPEKAFCPFGFWSFPPKYNTVLF
ncbi:hypothetical protein Taro_010327 [Colocasia esculenta]|uniref:Uncharacterized protein n=1 Tax=Colocasia esculenta TaxID=4460 RepID=A0A843TYN9_COLES|nr:hypothetical protein [Colocasia esculenta]